jgi:uncharacterized protein YbjQ (UPF0145 family)
MLGFTALGCSSFVHGNDVQFAEYPRTVAYCDNRGAVEAKVPQDPNSDAEVRAEEELRDQARALGADTVYRVKVDVEPFVGVTAKGTAYFCDRANKPNDYQ